MGKERSAASYDIGYRKNPRYKQDADHAPWAQLWYWVLDRTGQEMIIDFGCGPGHLAELLKRRDHPAHLYLGVDFSTVALEQARQRVPGYRFVTGNLPAATKRVARMQGEGPITVVFTEVLEHFLKDKAALTHLPSGTRVLASVPRKDSSGHVRHFTRLHHVCSRYEGLLDMRSVERIGGAYVFEGRRR